ncbi:MAG: phenylalanine--tRNA ligase subunit beta [Candidatus Omnitrophica bacterium]|nr:phenylalanine--tRNA ligase subunit beta [Candidatus Omnitrophota bacterium]
MRVSLNWLKDFMPIKDGPEKTRDELTMTGLEVTAVVNIEGDSVMDVEITPNRPDCLSILGVARELAAATNRQLKIPQAIKKHYMKKGPARGSARIEVQDKKACPRYVGCVIKNVKVGPSPKSLVQRLNAMGLRSVNNIVDITNYVLFESGQPLHAFDLDKLENHRIIVRRARKGESIVTIDGIKRELDPTMLVIADSARPVAIAGIMGGRETEISNETKNVLLESAYFDPIVIRKTQRSLGLASESSYRFERGVDFGMVLAASVRAQEMIKDEAGGKLAGKITDIGGKALKDKEVALSINEIPRVLGIDMPPAMVMEFFRRLDLKATMKPKNRIQVKIPSYRQDLEFEIDLIEELTRLYGYDKIPSKCPRFTMQKKFKEEKTDLVALVREIKKRLLSLGMSEIVTYTLTPRSAIEAIGRPFDNLVRLRNPLSSNQEFMRPSLLSEMMEVLSWNLNRHNSSLKLFELSKVYSMAKDGHGIEERINLSLGVSGATPGNWKEKPRDLDFFDLKGIIEMLLQFLNIKDFTIEKIGSPVFNETMLGGIRIKGDSVGEFGEVRQSVAKKFDIKQKIFLAELSVEGLLKYANLNRRFSPLPKYPSVKRDISMLMDDSVEAKSIVEVIKENADDLVRSIEVFDIYKGQQIEKGKKSLAYTLEYRSDERTLKDEEVSRVHKTIQDALVKKLGAQIR